MLSAGRERKAVNKEAKTADTFGKKKESFANIGLIISVII